MPATLTVVGLGSGDENQLTLGIWNKLQSANRLFLRTDKHPVVKFLRENQIAFRSFDDVYEQETDFTAVYESITAELLSLAKGSEGEIVYAVPGHPMVAEQTTQLLRTACPAEGIDLRVMGGESFLDQAFLRFGFDPIDGFQLLDGAALYGSRLNPAVHTVIGQIYDQFTASDVKLTLMELYPDDFPVVVGHSLGIAGEEIIREIPLYELDREPGFGNLSLLWVPRTDSERVRSRTFARLHEIVGILRSPGGCPWDREQTHASIRKNLIEETYEVLETIDDDDPDAMKEELGDLLLQVMLHAQMEEETGVFSVYDIIAVLNEKLIRRHPHVFGDREAGDAEEALANWQEIKREEKRAKGLDPEQASALDGVPRDLPGLMKAWKLQKKAAAVGFDWDRIEEVFGKVEEELGELREAISLNDAPESSIETEGELGDLLFAIVNLARFLRIDPEEAIARTNRKFKDRFAYIERQLRSKGKSIGEAGLPEMEAYWREAKTALD